MKIKCQSIIFNRGSNLHSSLLPCTLRLTSLTSNCKWLQTVSITSVFHILLHYQTKGSLPSSVISQSYHCLCILTDHRWRKVTALYFYFQAATRIICHLRQNYFVHWGNLPMAKFIQISALYWNKTFCALYWNLELFKKMSFNKVLRK